MPNKMDDEQMDFLGELLGDTPVVEESKVEEPLQSEEKQASEEPTEVQETQEVEESAQAEEPPEDVNAILREQIVKLTEQLQRDPFVQSVQTDVKDEKAPEGKTSEKLTAFLSEDEIDRIIDEPQLLNTAFNRAISVMQQNIQGVIQAEVNRQVMVTRAVSDFYTSNQDLAPYSKFVQFVMSEVEQQNPQKTYAEIFSLTAQESRKRLGMGSVPTVQRQQSRPDQQKPAFAGSKKSTARPAPKQDFFDQNAADMFNLS